MKFDLESCKALTDETRVQAIEADAREAAESHRTRAGDWRETPTEGLLWMASHGWIKRTTTQSASSGRRHFRKEKAD